MILDGIRAELKSAATVGLLVFIFCAPSTAQGVGSSGASFLRIMPMARPAAMGNAYTGLATGIEALTYNPAGIVSVDKWDVGLSQIVFPQQVRYSYAAVARRLSDKTVMALSMTYLGADDVLRNAAGANIGRFSNFDFAPALSLGYQLAPEIAVGGTLRVVHSELGDHKATAAGVDIGVKYEPLHWPGISFGAAVQNVGPGLEFISSSAPQPLSMRLGVAYEPSHRKFVLSGDLSVDREAQARASVGAEYRITDNFAVRTGFDVDNDASFVRALKMGAGFHSRVGSFDYAFESTGPSGNNHRFSYSFLGGQPRAVVDTSSIFAGGREVRSRVIIAVLPFVNLSPSTEHDWLGEGFKEIVSQRLARQQGIVLGERRAARYFIDGRFSVLGDDQLWVGIKVLSAADGSVVAFKEATILQSDLIASTTTLTGAVASVIPN